MPCLKTSISAPGRARRDDLGKARCAELGSEHRLTKPKRSQTNGMGERFDGRIAGAVAQHHFRSGGVSETTLLRHAWLYDQPLSQKVLGHVGPIQVMKNWQTSQNSSINARRSSGMRPLREPESFELEHETCGLRSVEIPMQIRDL